MVGLQLLVNHLKSKVVFNNSLERRDYVNYLRIDCKNHKMQIEYNNKMEPIAVSIKKEPL